MAPPLRGRALFVLAVLSVATAWPSTAQIRRPGAEAPVVVQPAAPDSPGGALALSGPVDPSSYILGPGDVFVITVGGGSLSGAVGQTTTTVTADGLLVIPQAGAFQAAGRSLAAVRGEARAALRNLYRNVPTDVALAAPRRFSVFVSGAVPSPGRQTVSALGRVEDAVAEATGALSPFDLADYSTPRDGTERRTALRNIQITGTNGDESLVDLLRYYATGEIRYNPLLRDGDAVFVPTFDPTREGVSVDGDVDRPGTYDRRPGDTVRDVVSAAGGASLDETETTVRRTRLLNGQSESVEATLAEAGRLDIRARDQISVRTGSPNAGLASAAGALRFPGTYPVQIGQTTLSDLVASAGGLASDALARGAYLERSVRPEPADPRTDTDADADSAIAASRPGRLSNLGLAGRRYFAEETASVPRLSVDLEAALSGAESITLRDGDRLVIPRDLGVVRVSGQVSAPGYIAYEPALTAGDYVSRAGGLGPVATTIYTIDARTGLFQAGRDTPVQAGDAVFVDRPPTFDSFEGQNQDIQARSILVQEENLALQREQAERSAAANRRQIIFQAVTTVATALSALATVYVAATR